MLDRARVALMTVHADVTQNKKYNESIKERCDALLQEIKRSLKCYLPTFSSLFLRPIARVIATIPLLQEKLSANQCRISVTLYFKQ